MSASQQSTSVREIVPLLFVDDIAACMEFYREKLGFQMVQSWEPEGVLNWCRIERDSAALMLQLACEEDGPAEGRGRGVGFFFNCGDADAMYAELRAKGVEVAPPKVAFYGMNQLFVTDPAGYELCFQNEAVPAP